MALFFNMFIDCIADLLSQLSSLKFSVGELQVDFLSVMFAFLVLGFAVNVFWRGAKT